MAQDTKTFELVNKAKSGDNAAFGELYNNSYKMVYLTCMGYLKNREDAEDVTQEVYMYVYTKLSTLQDNNAFYGWLKTSAIHACLNRLKSSKSFVSFDDAIGGDDLSEGSDDIEMLPDTYVLHEEKRKIMMDIMEKNLSQAQYVTLFMYYYDNLKIEQIASFMDVPVSTVKTRLKRGKAAIKKGIEDYENETGDRLAVANAIPSLSMIFKAAVNSTPVSVMPFAGAGAGVGSGVGAGVSAAAKGAGAAAKGAASKAILAKVMASVLAISVIGAAGVGVMHILNKKNDTDKKEKSSESKIETSDSVQDQGEATTLDTAALYNVGDTFNYGVYDGQPITWRVIDVEDGNYFVMAEYGLDVKRFNENSGDYVWANCTLRTWLNYDFYMNSFTPEERGRINLTTVEDGVDDRIYLLSRDEIDTYFTSSRETMCLASDTVINNGGNVSDNGYCSWWLRDMGNFAGDAETISMAGTYGDLRRQVNLDFIAVRPVMWVNLEGDVAPVTDDMVPAPAPVEFVNDFSVGGKVTFGNYMGEDITWLVLDEKDGNYLVMSEMAVTGIGYNADGDNCTWENSSLRGWLNTVFYDMAFSHDQQTHILTTTVMPEENPFSPVTDQGNSTEDKIYILSINEARTYFANRDGMECHPMTNALSWEVIQNMDGTCLWWLRNSGQFQNYASFVGDHGAISERGYYVETIYGVRPVMWVTP